MLAILSTVRGGDRSTIAHGLARELGQRVLLLEARLSHAALHLMATPEPGLAAAAVRVVREGRRRLEQGQPDVLGVVVNRARRLIPGRLFRRI